MRLCPCHHRHRTTADCLLGGSHLLRRNLGLGLGDVVTQRLTELTHLSSGGSCLDNSSLGDGLGINSLKNKSDESRLNETVDYPTYFLISSHFSRGGSNDCIGIKSRRQGGRLDEEGGSVVVEQLAAISRHSGRCGGGDLKWSANIIM